MFRILKRFVWGEQYAHCPFCDRGTRVIYNRCEHCGNEIPS